MEAYYTVTVAATELGTLCSLRRDEAQTPAGSVSAALALLHARACQTSAEVHALLAAGFPRGAYARYRTLHGAGMWNDYAMDQEFPFWTT